eukprot:m.167358 g.167358  ORF g.167358 m.167358 type:complete len:422 (+) comp21125_c3_seq3:80-1345(+)
MSRATKRNKHPACEGCKQRTGQLLVCKSCEESWHTACLDYPPRLARTLMEQSDWQCPDCKTCQICDKKNKQKELLICDRCDRGLHMGCAVPQVPDVPKGPFFCDSCRYDSRLRSHHKQEVETKRRPFKMFAVADTPDEAIEPLAVGPRDIETVSFGAHIISTLYNSPYPESYRIKHLFICEVCLRYFRSQFSLLRHSQRCEAHPPGEEIYRDGHLSVWEVDGKQEPPFCRNLCLLAKLFLEQKTLYYEVGHFLFYVLTEWTPTGAKVLGYFSKENVPTIENNLSCLLTLPQYRQQGYGKLLIDFSYLLTRAEKKVGSPEKPLSDLGLVTYRSYWRDKILEFLSTFQYNTISIVKLSEITGISQVDIISTLQAYEMVKYWRGEHVILRPKDIKEQLSKRKPQHKLDSKLLKWKPRNSGGEEA